MFLTFEALQARYGDCLLIHYGEESDPKIILVDGGPGNVYSNSLKPRLSAIKNARFKNRPLPLSMAMISHADEDHIYGIIELTAEMVQEKEDKILPNKKKYKIANLWFNSFDDIVGNDEMPLLASIKDKEKPTPAQIQAIPELKGLDEHTLAIIASTGQGRTIRDAAITLDIPYNRPYTALDAGKARLVRGDIDQKPTILDELEINVIHPNATSLKKLQKKWDTDLKAYKKKGDPNIILGNLASTDTSVFNLSSIVCLLKYEQKTILITGDATSQNIYEGLKLNNFLDGSGKIHVDILKLPHHGSARNMTDEFLKNVTAEHYVISANGRDDNPDQKTLDMLERNVTKGTIHLTNDIAEPAKDGTPDNTLQSKINAFKLKMKNTRPNVKIEVRDPAKPSIVIDLISTLTY